MNTVLILIILLILLGAGSFPAWPHSMNWGYGPTGSIGVVIIVLLVLMVLGKL